MCCLGAGHNGEPARPTAAALRGGLRGRCHICPCEQFHHAISELPFTSNSATQSPTKCFWMANSLAVHWCFVRSLLRPRPGAGWKGTAGGQMGFEFAAVLPREKVEPPRRHAGDTRKRHKAQPQECVLASGRRKGRQITPEGKNPRGRFYRNFSLFTQFPRLMVSRFFPPRLGLMSFIPITKVSLLLFLVLSLR